MTPRIQKFRSMLYVPANRNDFIEMGHTRGADAYILDLEDSVAPEFKNVARGNLASSIDALGRGGAPVIVRINSQQDAALADAKAALTGGAYALSVPKANQKILLDIDVKLNQWEAKLTREPVKLLALIEDPDGVLNAQSIADCPRVWALSVGSEDLALAIGANPSEEVLKLPKQLVHYAAKSRGLYSFGLFRSIADYRDTQSIDRAARQAKGFGFDGASCVHPNAIAILNEAFKPPQEDVKWAKTVIEATKQSQNATFSLAGQMIDAPIILRAKTILQNA